jgi:hypothetical protein
MTGIIILTALSVGVSLIFSDKIINLYPRRSNAIDLSEDIDSIMSDKPEDHKNFHTREGLSS